MAPISEEEKLDNRNPENPAYPSQVISTGYGNTENGSKFGLLKQGREGGLFMSLVIVGFAAFGGIVFGYDSGSINGVLNLEPFKERFGVRTFDQASNEWAWKIDSRDQALIVSMLSLGTCIGALSVGEIADRFGRKGSILISSFVFMVGCALQTATVSVPMLVVARVIAGLGVGAISGLVPLYQGEGCPKHLRGMITSLYQFFITIGLLLAACVAQGIKNSVSKSGYEIIFALQIVWAFVLFVGMLFLPESPRYYVRKNQNDKAIKSLIVLRNLPPEHPKIQEELNDIIVTVREELDSGRTSWLECFRKNKERCRRRTLTGMAAQAMQQLTGVNFIFYFSTSFFQTVGIKKPFIITIATNVVNVGATPFSFYTIERFGRRKLLLIGAAVMVVCEFVVAIVNTVLPNSSSATTSLIVFVLVYIASFAITWGPTCWVLVGELFPLHTRAKGVALASASNWFMNWVIAYVTPYLVADEGKSAHLGGKVFFIWGTTCVLSFFFAYFFVPELKGLSLEETEELWEHYTTARATAKFVPTLRQSFQPPVSEMTILEKD